MDGNPEVGLVGAHDVLVDENRGERYVRMPPTEHSAMVRATARYIPFAHTLVMFRKDAWQQVGGYPDARNIIDLRFAVRIAGAGWKLAYLSDVLGTHRVHSSSFWHQTYTYRRRQRELAAVQAGAIHKLGLPVWMYLYPMGRLFYVFMPIHVKRLLRRTVGGSREKDTSAIK